MIGSPFVLMVVQTLAACSALGLALANSAKPGGSAEISPDLLALYEAYREAQRTRASFRSDSPLLQIVEDRVVIDAAATSDAQELKADLAALGMRHSAAFGRLVSGELPIAAIPALSSLGSLAFVRSAAAARLSGPGATPCGP